MARPANGAPITFIYADRAVHGECRWRALMDTYDLSRRYFMAESPSTTPKSLMVEYEGITWERGWTDGVALLAAHALARSR